MLREARVVMLKNARGHAQLREDIKREFGAFLETEGKYTGEQARVYDFAAPLGDVAAGEIMKITKAAVYVRFPDGTVTV